MKKYNKFEDEENFQYRITTGKDSSFNENNLYEVTTVQAHKLNLRTIRLSAIIQLLSYAMFAFVVVRLAVLLIVTYLSIAFESMLLPPGREGSQAIPRYDRKAFTVEFVVGFLI